MSKNEKLLKKRGRKDIRIIKVAAFSFAIVSWFATAEGLSTYIFNSSVWQPALISFGIQGILFVLNLKLPEYIHQIGRSSTKVDPPKEPRWLHDLMKIPGRIKAFCWTNIVRCIFILFYAVVLLSSRDRTQKIYQKTRMNGVTICP